MNNYVCQAESNCERVQSAVCLHCQRRLCLEHLAEHNSVALNRFGELTNEVRLTYEQLKADSEKRRDTVEQQLNSFHQWYNEQKLQLEQLYDQGLKSIQSRREFFIDEEFKLAQQLEQHAFQPLKQLQDQGVVNTELINQIQDTINKTRETNSALQQVLTPSTSQPQPQIQIQKKSNSGVPHRMLFSMFSNLESIPENRKLIRAYIKSQGERLDIPSFICSFLTSWHRKADKQEKQLLFKSYFSIVRRVLSKRTNDTLVFLGIQQFVLLEDIHEDGAQTMSFLLRFLLRRHCISQKGLFEWFHRTRKPRSGYLRTRRLAQPFAESLQRRKSKVI